MDGWHYKCTACCSSKQRVLLCLMCIVTTGGFCNSSQSIEGTFRPRLRGSNGWRDKAALRLVVRDRGSSMAVSEGANGVPLPQLHQKGSKYKPLLPYSSLGAAPSVLSASTVSSRSQELPGAWHPLGEPAPHASSSTQTPSTGAEMPTAHMLPLKPHESGAHKLSRRHLLQGLQQAIRGGSSSRKEDGSSQASSSFTKEAEVPVLPPPSCLNGGRWKYAQLEVQLGMNVTSDEDIVDVTSRASYAVAKQLNLKNSNGELDTSRVESYIDSVHSEPGNALLDIYIYLSPMTCEVSRQIWLDHAVSANRTLFAVDAQLAAAVKNVTAVIGDPGRLAKSSVQSSANEVVSMILGSSTPGSGTNSSSNGDGGAGVVQDAGLSYVSPYMPGTTVDGLLVLGATTGSLLAVVLLLALMQRYADWRVRRRMQATVTAAVAAATAAATAAVAAARDHAALAAEAGSDSDSDSVIEGDVEMGTSWFNGAGERYSATNIDSNTAVIAAR